MHHAHGVAIVHHRHDLAAGISGSALRVVALGDDPVEELAAGAELHDEIDGVAVLVGALELHDVAVAGEVVHDLDLAPDIIDIVAVYELARCDRLARELLLRDLVGHQVRHAELPAAQLAPKDVNGPDILHGPAQHAAKRGRRLGLREWG